MEIHKIDFVCIDFSLRTSRKAKKLLSQASL